MLKIAHIINPVIVDSSSDLHAAQPVTFESMRQAQKCAEGKVSVGLFSAQFPEDRDIVPEWFTRTRDLDRSVLDVGTFQRQRKLPLIGDILGRLLETSNADYFVYTNVDIALMPHFYTAVAMLIDSGFDAMVINRRTIAKLPSDPAKLPLMWGQAGEKHPGHDCFVFRRDFLPKFSLGQVCIGAAWVGRALIWNLCVQANRFSEFTDLHLTFHIGNDKVWKNNVYADYENHNRRQVAEILDDLMAVHGPFGDTSPIYPYLEPDPRGRTGEARRSELLSKLFARK